MMSKLTATAEETSYLNRRKRRRLDHKPNIGPDDRIHSFEDCAAAADLSPATFRRQVASGQGPIITRLSQRRLGVRGRHFCAWLDARAASPEGS
jgi:hypothetical protein